MRLNLRGVHSFVWVYDEETSDEVFALVRYVLPDGMLEGELTCLDFVEQNEVIFVPEGRTSTK